MNKVLNQLYQNKKILLTLATGTGKTKIAFQIAWNFLRINGVLMVLDRKNLALLVDRNILADQTMNEFNQFPKNSHEIKPKKIKTDGRVPTNGFVFFKFFKLF